MRNKLFIGVIGIVIGALLTSTVMVLAGNINSPSGLTDPASQMYTMQQVYDRINNGTAAAKMTTFTEPAAGPGSTMHTLDELYALAGERSRPAKTGQTISYATGDDGELEKGVAWPNPRFTDNGNGTVTDNLTGLIWLRLANCYESRSWANALSAANTLNSGECGLNDGSAEGDWRLPNLRELQSLIDYGQYNPALPSAHPFSGVQFEGGDKYWTSTTYVRAESWAWAVYLGEGNVVSVMSDNPNHVWPVRGGE